MIELIPEAQAHLSFESYPPAPDIEGVWVQPLRKHRSNNGWFMELARLSGGRLEDAPLALEVRQVSVARADAGRVNAFHIHTKLEQNEIWTVLDGQLLVWLVDCRAESPTAGARRPVLITGEEPARLFIPAGVAHGYKAGRQGALLQYSMDQQFDSSDPNEGRLPWDHFGPELWDDNRG